MGGVDRLVASPAEHAGASVPRCRVGEGAAGRAADPERRARCRAPRDREARCTARPAIVEATAGGADSEQCRTAAERRRVAAVSRAEAEHCRTGAERARADAEHRRADAERARAVERGKFFATERARPRATNPAGAGITRAASAARTGGITLGGMAVARRVARPGNERPR